MFDPHRGSWQALGAQLSSERKYCAAASLGGRLLVLGGMNEARRRCGAHSRGLDVPVQSHATMQQCNSHCSNRNDWDLLLAGHMPSLALLMLGSVPAFFPIPHAARR